MMFRHYEGDNEDDNDDADNDNDDDDDDDDDDDEDDNDYYTDNDNDDDDDSDDAKVEGVTGHTVITEFSGDKVVRSEMDYIITPVYDGLQKYSSISSDTL